MTDLKSTLRAITLELRSELEGKYDAQGNWQAGDLERRLAAIGVRRDRAPVPVDELTATSDDRDARRVVDAFVKSHVDAGQSREAAIAEFVRNAAYTWANRLLALRCMEARGLIDEVVLQKDTYAGRSLQHQRLARKEPERCAGEDGGLSATLFDEFSRRAQELPLVFDPRAAEVALRPSVAALKRCIALLSGTIPAKGQRATDAVFAAPDALGWAYQYWNTEEKDRVFEKVKNKALSKEERKISGSDIIPATCIYTEPYMVRFLLQNSLGAIWMRMNPGSHLCEGWEYYARDADRAPVSRKPVTEIAVLDPACGSGHFLLEAFELLYAMYLEEAVILEPEEICAAILERNLFGIDIDERAVQIAALALVMKAKEKAPGFVPRRVNLVATNIRLPAAKEHLEAFLAKHPDDASLMPALVAIFEGLAHADQLGSLLQIEEPVDRALHALRDEQLARERKAAAGTLFGPRNDDDWAAWQQRVVERLRQHFGAEALAVDLATAFFGEAATKGLSLVDILARRYDVVAANPPYMGSRNMGAVVKRYLECQFSPGKGDLYAAFILRCLQLAANGGRVAMVTQHSWMFLRSFADLRARDEKKRRKASGASGAFRGVLRETTIEALAHLGSHAFGEVGGEVVSTSLFVLSRNEPLPSSRVTAVRLVGLKTPEEKKARLHEALDSRQADHPAVYRPYQMRFLTIPQTPLCYWLPEQLFDLLRGPTLGDVAEVCQGLATAEDARFVRYVWEVAPAEWAVELFGRRWVPFEKGGGYGKWFGNQFWVVDWERKGERLKRVTVERYGNIGKRIYNEEHYFKQGWTNSVTAQGSLAVRWLDQAVFSTQGTGIVLRRAAHIACFANCRLATALIRGMTAQMYFRESYVARIPLPERVSERFGVLEDACLELKRTLVALKATERTFEYVDPAGGTLREAFSSAAEVAEAVAAALHTLEGVSEREVFSSYGIADKNLRAVLDETGTPAGWFPLVAGYDAAPSLPERVGHVAGLFQASLARANREMSLAELTDLKRRLRASYKAGPGAKPGEDDPEPAQEGSDNEEEEEEAISAGSVPIPTETFLEELSNLLEVHPVSVYWLLREVRETGDVVCRSELVHFVEDYVSTLVLRLLGHRWPRDVESGKPSPIWMNRDGIIAITAGTGEPALITRIRESIAGCFGVNRAGAVEREFEEITGLTLGAWLASDFFKRQISKFRKRPVAWQLVSARVNRRGTPAFSCLLYFHQLDADLLPKLRTQYVGPLRASLQTELAGLERHQNRSAEQDARRLELEEKVDELKAFDARLEEVTLSGFGSPALDQVAASETLDQWASRDGRAPAPMSREAFLSQESRYSPDLNDGVRVNIAPLQRAGLLATDVLAAKDVEKALDDRAEWRADERRWCREGKLPQPGWWPAKDKG